MADGQRKRVPQWYEVERDKLKESHTCQWANAANDEFPIVKLLMERLPPEEKTRSFKRFDLMKFDDKRFTFDAVMVQTYDFGTQLFQRCKKRDQRVGYLAVIMKCLEKCRLKLAEDMKTASTEEDKDLFHHQIAAIQDVELFLTDKIMRKPWSAITDGAGSISEARVHKKKQHSADAQKRLSVFRREVNGMVVKYGLPSIELKEDVTPVKCRVQTSPRTPEPTDTAERDIRAALRKRSSQVRYNVSDGEESEDEETQVSVESFSPATTPPPKKKHCRTLELSNEDCPMEAENSLVPSLPENVAYPPPPAAHIPQITEELAPTPSDKPTGQTQSDYKNPFEPGPTVFFKDDAAPDLFTDFGPEPVRASRFRGPSQFLFEDMNVHDDFKEAVQDHAGDLRYFLEELSPMPSKNELLDPVLRTKVLISAPKILIDAIMKSSHHWCGMQLFFSANDHCGIVRNLALKGKPFVDKLKKVVHCAFDQQVDVIVIILAATELIDCCEVNLAGPNICSAMVGEISLPGLFEYIGKQLCSEVLFGGFLDQACPEPAELAAINAKWPAAEKHWELSSIHYQNYVNFVEDVYFSFTKSSDMPSIWVHFSNCTLITPSNWQSGYTKKQCFKKTGEPTELLLKSTSAALAASVSGVVAGCYDFSMKLRGEDRQRKLRDRLETRRKRWTFEMRQLDLRMQQRVADFFQLPIHTLPIDNRFYKEFLGEAAGQRLAILRQPQTNARNGAPPLRDEELAREESSKEVNREIEGIPEESQLCGDPPKPSDNEDKNGDVDECDEDEDWEDEDENAEQDDYDDEDEDWEDEDENAEQDDYDEDEEIEEEEEGGCVDDDHREKKNRLRIQPKVVRIGTYEAPINGDVLVSWSGFVFPTITVKGFEPTENVRLKVRTEHITGVMVYHGGKGGVPVIIIYTTLEEAGEIRYSLGMPDDEASASVDEPLYEPSSKNESRRRIMIFPDEPQCKLVSEKMSKLWQNLTTSHGHPRWCEMKMERARQIIVISSLPLVQQSANKVVSLSENEEPASRQTLIDVLGAYCQCPICIDIPKGVAVCPHCGRIFCTDCHARRRKCVCCGEKVTTKGLVKCDWLADMTARMKTVLMVKWGVGSLPQKVMMNLTFARDKFKCRLCGELAKDPVLCSSCLFVFCDGCMMVTLTSWNQAWLCCKIAEKDLVPLSWGEKLGRVLDKLIDANTPKSNNTAKLPDKSVAGKENKPPETTKPSHVFCDSEASFDGSEVSIHVGSSSSSSRDSRASDVDMEAVPASGSRNLVGGDVDAEVVASPSSETETRLRLIAAPTKIAGDQDGEHNNNGMDNVDNSDAMSKKGDD